jgi:Family of unknown function (DUF6502)
VTTRSEIVLHTVLGLLRPVVRLMLRHGVTYTAFTAALKRVFLQAAQDELKASDRAQTDSAVSLLSGVHRRDVRNLTRNFNPLSSPDAAPQGFTGLASQVMARWLSDEQYLDTAQNPVPLPRTGDAPSFDALVRSVSQDVRSRSVLDELARLGLAAEADGVVTLLVHGFVPRVGFAELAAQLHSNLQDHLSAACQNLEGQGDFLEQAVFVDEITEESVLHLHKTAARAWRTAFTSVMRQAQVRFDHDAKNAPPNSRNQRARFGVYFYSTPDEVQSPAAAPPEADAAPTGSTRKLAKKAQ